MEEIGSHNDFDKQRKIMRDKLAKLGKDSDSKVVKQINDEKRAREDIELQAKLDVARKIFFETMEMINEGDMKFEEGMKDLSKVILKI